MDVILTQPVATRGAVFWIGWSFLIRDGEALGNQMGAYIHEKKPDRGYIGDKYGFLLLHQLYQQGP